MHCDQCGGRGKVTKHVCGTCHGHRVVQSTATLNLHVDRGVPVGTEIVFEGESDESPDWEAGDMILKIREHKRVGGFVRKESNLYWKESLSVAEVSNIQSLSIIVLFCTDVCVLCRIYRLCWDSNEQSKD